VAAAIAAAAAIAVATSVTPGAAPATPAAAAADDDDDDADGGPDVPPPDQPPPPSLPPSPPPAEVKQPIQTPVSVAIQTVESALAGIKQAALSVIPVTTLIPDVTIPNTNPLPIVPPESVPMDVDEKTEIADVIDANQAILLAEIKQKDEQFAQAQRYIDELQASEDDLIQQVDRLADAMEKQGAQFEKLQRQKFAIEIKQKITELELRTQLNEVNQLNLNATYLKNLQDLAEKQTSDEKTAINTQLLKQVTSLQLDLNRHRIYSKSLEDKNTEFESNIAVINATTEQLRGEVKDLSDQRAQLLLNKQALEANMARFAEVKMEEILQLQAATAAIQALNLAQSQKISELTKTEGELAEINANSQNEIGQLIAIRDQLAQDNRDASEALRKEREDFQLKDLQYMKELDKARQEILNLQSEDLQIRSSASLLTTNKQQTIVAIQGELRRSKARESAMIIQIDALRAEKKNGIDALEAQILLIQQVLANTNREKGDLENVAIQQQSQIRQIELEKERLKQRQQDTKDQLDGVEQKFTQVIQEKNDLLKKRHDLDIEILESQRVIQELAAKNAELEIVTRGALDSRTITEEEFDKVLQESAAYLAQRNEMFQNLSDERSANGRELAQKDLELKLALGLLEPLQTQVNSLLGDKRTMVEEYDRKYLELDRLKRAEVAVANAAAVAAFSKLQQNDEKVTELEEQNRILLLEKKTLEAQTSGIRAQAARATADQNETTLLQQTLGLLSKKLESKEAAILATASALTIAKISVDELTSQYTSAQKDVLEKVEELRMNLTNVQIDKVKLGDELAANQLKFDEITNEFNTTVKVHQKEIEDVKGHAALEIQNLRNQTRTLELGKAQLLGSNTTLQDQLSLQDAAFKQEITLRVLAHDEAIATLKRINDTEKLAFEKQYLSRIESIQDSHALERKTLQQNISKLEAETLVINDLKSSIQDKLQNERGNTLNIRGELQELQLKALLNEKEKDRIKLDLNKTLEDFESSKLALAAELNNSLAEAKANQETKLLELKNQQADEIKLITQNATETTRVKVQEALADATSRQAFAIEQIKRDALAEQKRVVSKAEVGWQKAAELREQAVVKNVTDQLTVAENAFDLERAALLGQLQITQDKLLNTTDNEQQLSERLAAQAAAYNKLIDETKQDYLSQIQTLQLENADLEQSKVSLAAKLTSLEEERDIKELTLGNADKAIIVLNERARLAITDNHGLQTQIQQINQEVGQLNANLTINPQLIPDGPDVTMVQAPDPEVKALMEYEHEEAGRDLNTLFLQQQLFTKQREVLQDQAQAIASTVQQAIIGKPITQPTTSALPSRTQPGSAARARRTGVPLRRASAPELVESKAAPTPGRRNVKRARFVDAPNPTKLLMDEAIQRVREEPVSGWPLSMQKLVNLGNFGVSAETLPTPAEYERDTGVRVTQQSIDEMFKMPGVGDFSDLGFNVGTNDPQLQVFNPDVNFEASAANVQGYVTGAMSLITTGLASSAGTVNLLTNLNENILAVTNAAASSFTPIVNEVPGIAAQSMMDLGISAIPAAALAGLVYGGAILAHQGIKRLRKSPAEKIETVALETKQQTTRPKEKSATYGRFVGYRKQPTLKDANLELKDLKREDLNELAASEEQFDEFLVQVADNIKKEVPTLTNNRVISVLGEIWAFLNSGSEATTEDNEDFNFDASMFESFVGDKLTDKVVPNENKAYEALYAQTLNANSFKDVESLLNNPTETKQSASLLNKSAEKLDVKKETIVAQATKIMQERQKDMLKNKLALHPSLVADRRVVRARFVPRYPLLVPTAPYVPTTGPTLLQRLKEAENKRLAAEME
jgi:hypothetical protein